MLGIALSSPSSLLLPPDEWAAEYSRLAIDSADHQPYLRDGEQDHVADYASATQVSLKALSDELSAIQADALVVIGCWRNETSPQTATFTILSSTSGAEEMPTAEYQPRHRRLDAFLLDELVSRGFDIAWQPQATQLPESVAIAVKALKIEDHTTVIPVLINASKPPLPSATRCWDLGAAIHESLASREERVAVIATGGLSYDVLGRWVDEPFDRWFLSALQANDSAAIKTLFRVESEVLQGRTGEIRSWITAAGACAAPARIVDYFPARQARSGIGFLLWGNTTH